MAATDSLSARVPDRLSILALEPWLGGSHERFLTQWRSRSIHDVRVLGLSARDWKWRMRAGAWELARTIAAGETAPPDVLLASDFLDLPVFFGLVPEDWSRVPCAVYFHENQLTYPTPPGSPPRERDFHFGFTNILSALRATAVVFNSHYHLESFAKAADELLSRIPRPNPRMQLREKLSRSPVISPGVDASELQLDDPCPRAHAGPLRIAFNHRWEHDKDPAAFLRAVRAALREGAELELVLLGESYPQLPPGTEGLLEELAGVTRHRGFAADRRAYLALLLGCDVCVSTARHEFFGLSVVEAMAAGCTPLVPHRLAYPEILPRDLHASCLYERDEDLAARLAEAARDPSRFRLPEQRRRMRAAASPHDAGRSARRLDELCTALARGHSLPAHESERSAEGGS